MKKNKGSFSTTKHGFSVRHQLSAAAIAYEAESMKAPELSAFGRDEQAREIRRLALRYGIPIKYEQQTTQKLSSLKLEEEIPEEMYDEIARLLLEVEKRGG